MIDSLTTLKLILLYILQRSDTPLSHSQLSEFVLEKEYASYFLFQQAVSELIDAEFIHARQVRNSSSYTITPSGQETLSAFGNAIPDFVYRDVYLYFEEHHCRLQNENNTIADYYRKEDDLYIVNCAVYEGDQQLFGVSLSVATRKQAEAICDRFKKQNPAVYAYLIQTLLLG